MEPLGFTRVAIVGHGLIGGSIALAARQRLPLLDVVTLDRGDDLALAAAADLIILAAPIGGIIRLLDTLRPILGPATLVTDTGSTKAAIVNAARGLRFIGGHPIAGAAAGGREAARPDLFDHRSWVLTPDETTDAHDLGRLEAFARSLGGTPVTLGPLEHDRIFGFTSHLPQLVASALLDTIAAAVGGDGLAFSGAGLRDTTRLAGSPAGMWQDVVLSNRANVTAALDAMIDTLSRLRDDSDGAELRAVFERAARWRARLGAGDAEPPI